MKILLTVWERKGMFLDKVGVFSPTITNDGGERDMRILVCDDDARFAQKLSGRLQELTAPTDERVQIDCFSDPQTLTDSDLARYDIAFLDIDMGEMSGLALARRLRGVRQDTVLIFVTNYVEYSLEGYEVQAFRYLLKSDLDGKLECYTQQAIAAYCKGREMIRLLCDDGERDISVQSIVFAETGVRRMILHLRNVSQGTLSTRITMAQLTETLTPLGFLKIHKSYLVNMQSIKRLQSTQAILTDDTILPVSAHRYDAIKDDYLEWRERNRWSIG